MAAAPTLVAASLKGLCPRCGAHTLFAGLVSFANRCRACQLDFKSSDVGGGPEVFLILIVGTITVVGALLVELRFAPPWWVHLMWIPIALILTVTGLRVAKAALFYQSFRHQAGEGRIVK
ncbi:MAG: DUF983 domain-containing protein [Sphingomicrobium sp.]